jgi:hypothetical protein
MVVQAHFMLRAYICERAATFKTWSTTSIDKQWGKGPADSRTNKPETVAEQAAFLHAAMARYQRTFRDDRLLWFMSSGTAPINWANYLTFDRSLTTPSLDGRKLRLCLDMTTATLFGCKFSDLMDKDEWDEELEDHWADDDSTNIDALDDYFAVLEEEEERDGSLELSDFDCKYQVRTTSSSTSPPAARTVPLSLASLSLGISGHAYLRDNPIKDRIARAATEPTASIPGTAINGDEDRRIFFVNNKQLKLVERLFGKREGKVSWAGLVHVSGVGLPHPGHIKRLTDRLAFQAPWLPVGYGLLSLGRRR